MNNGISLNCETEKRIEDQLRRASEVAKGQFWKGGRFFLLMIVIILYLRKRQLWAITSSSTLQEARR